MSKELKWSDHPEVHADLSAWLEMANTGEPDSLLVNASLTYGNHGCLDVKVDGHWYTLKLFAFEGKVENHE